MALAMAVRCPAMPAEVSTRKRYRTGNTDSAFANRDAASSHRTTPKANGRNHGCHLATDDAKQPFMTNRVRSKGWAKPPRLSGPHCVRPLPLKEKGRSIAAFVNSQSSWDPA